MKQSPFKKTVKDEDELKEVKTVKDEDELKEVKTVKDEDELKEVNGNVAADCDFTGVARSVECYLVNGQFNNFRIVTIHIERGRVVRTEYSDAWAGFETISRLEIMNERSILNLNHHWKNGDALAK